MIFVIGGTGTIGSELVPRLVDAGAEVRCLVRGDAAAGRVRSQGVEAVGGDVADRAALAEAMRGCESAFFVLPSSPGQGELEEGVVAAAREAGVARVVKSSVLGVGPEADFVFGRWHAPGEAALEASGLDWTFLRPNGFCQNSLRDAPAIKDGGRFFSPLGDAAVSWIDVRDIAEVAVRALTEPGHAGRAYEMTGPAALSHGDVAAELSRASGRDVAYVPVPDDAARHGMVGAGVPEGTADALIELFAWYRSGGGAAVSPDVERALGRPPWSYADFARDHADVFR